MDGKKYRSVMGCSKDRVGGVYCLLEVPEGCSCQVNTLQCTLEGVEIVGRDLQKNQKLLYPVYDGAR